MVNPKNSICEKAATATTEELQLLEIYLSGMMYCRDHPENTAAVDTLNSIETLVEAGDLNTVYEIKRLTWRLKDCMKNPL